MTKQIEVAAKLYEDHDDCLTAAAQDYASDHGLEAWQVSAEWLGGEDGERETIVLTVPGVTHEQAEVRKAVDHDKVDADITALSAEAAQAGDLAQVALCIKALDGDKAARVECLRVLSAAAAMRDDQSQ